MSLLIGLGLFVGVAVALGAVVTVACLIASSDRALIALCIVFVLSLANLMGWGMLHDSEHMPLWVWLPPVVSIILIIAIAVFASDDGGW